jgi:hypothetical protein
LKVILSGVSASVYQSRGQREHYLLSNLDLSVDVKIGKGCTNISCQLSDVSTFLSYTDYVTSLSILRDNIGKKADRKTWDNIEAAWEKESLADLQNFSTDVAYTENARLVRYGQKKGSAVSGKTMLFDIWFGKLSVLLRRDEYSEHSNISDLMLLQFHDFKLDMGEKRDGDQWLNASLGKIFVFDLGRKGRLNDRKCSEDFEARDDCEIAVIVEGYSPLESSKKTKIGPGLDSQVVLKFERDISGDTKASIIVSYLTLNACLTPLHEFENFFSCRWNVPNEYKIVAECSDDSATTDVKGFSSPELRSNFYFRFVLHYPRIVFIADENDFHSKALVTQG